MKSFPDGTSNTIMLATRYGNSGSIISGGTSVNCSPYDGLLLAGSSSSVGQGSFFGISVMSGAPTPLLTSPGGWQLAPTLANVNCSIFSGNTYLGLAHSFDITGLQIAMCDGSVHVVQGSMSSTTWNIALQPNDGLPMGTDWTAGAQ
jgi:hypothetical protein